MEYNDIAQAYSCEVRYPSKHHVQFIHEELPDHFYNWYPSTGTFGLQVAGKKWERLPSTFNIEEVLKQIQLCTTH